jgi:hypothetical protein
VLEYLVPVAEQIGAPPNDAVTRALQYISADTGLEDAELVTWLLGFNRAVLDELRRGSCSRAIVRVYKRESC